MGVMNKHRRSAAVPETRGCRIAAVGWVRSYKIARPAEKVGCVPSVVGGGKDQ